MTCFSNFAFTWNLIFPLSPESFKVALNTKKKKCSHYKNEVSLYAMSSPGYFPFFYAPLNNPLCLKHLCSYSLWRLCDQLSIFSTPLNCHLFNNDLHIAKGSDQLSVFILLFLSVVFHIVNCVLLYCLFVFPFRESKPLGFPPDSLAIYFQSPLLVHLFSPKF